MYSGASPRRRRSAPRRVAAIFACALAFAAHAADPAKVLRVASFDIDTLDPQQYSDDPSFQVVQAIFEPLFEWDYLSSSPKLTPLTAAGPAEITDGGKVWTNNYIQPWLMGFSPFVFTSYWKYLDIDLARRR